MRKLNTGHTICSLSQQIEVKYNTGIEILTDFQLH